MIGLIERFTHKNQRADSHPLSLMANISGGYTVKGWNCLIFSLPGKNRTNQAG
jgi:hypothetical protein